MKVIIGFILFSAVFVGTIFAGEGMSALRPFLMAETLLMVVLGTAVILFSTFPIRTIRESLWLLFGRIAEVDTEMKTRASDLFNSAAHTWFSTGIIVTLYGIILVLINATDINRLPIRLAFALTALFYGLLLSIFFKALDHLIKYSRLCPVSQGRPEDHPRHR